MSASTTCPQCNGTTFRSPDGGASYMICECIEFDDADEEAEQQVFKALHDALVGVGRERAMDKAEFCGQLLIVAQRAVKICKSEF